MIERDHALPIKRQAALVGISRGTAYFRPEPVSQEDLALMRRMGLCALYRQPSTSRKNPAHPVFAYLLRDLAIERANQAWALNITYIMISSAEFVAEVARIGARQSMDGKGCWRDNVFVQQLWRSVKYEDVYLKVYESVTAARCSLDAYTGVLQRTPPAPEPRWAHAGHGLRRAGADAGGGLKGLAGC